MWGGDSQKMKNWILNGFSQNRAFYEKRRKHTTNLTRAQLVADIQWELHANSSISNSIQNMQDTLGKG